MQDTNPSFPPLLSSKPVRAPKRPFETACSDALQGKAEAGDVYWAKNNRILDCAIVLEPEVPLAQALQMTYVVMVAFGDAFGAVAEAEVGMHYLWPDKFMIHRAEVGRLRIAAPKGTKAGQVPAWLIFNIIIEMKGEDDIEPGLNLDKTTLFDEGCGEITTADLIESFCRYFLTWVHSWEEDGFRAVHDIWITRAIGHEEIAEIKINGETYTGKVMGIDETSQLLLSEDGKNLATLDLQHIIEWQG